jgi:hypothetical protein
MSVDSPACPAPVGEELVEITSGGKTYLVPQALAEEVLRRREAKAVWRARFAAAAPTTMRKRRHRKGFGGSTRSRAARTVHLRPGRGRVRLIA